jgi:Zn-dependent M28 family amino/carboxypeptidase
VLERLHLATRSNEKRQAHMEQLFRDAGCSDSLTFLKVKSVKQPNIVCEYPGESESVILVVAHFDAAGKGHGAADNWSGAALLPSLYEDMKKEPRKHRFQFVSFSGEEVGLIGSKQFVSKLTKEERERIQAVVNMDTLGLSDTKIWISHSEPKLTNMLIGVAKALQFPVSGMNVEQVGTSDSQSFKRQKIPVIDVHSVTQETLPILHSERDVVASIDEEAYWKTYQLVSAYLVYLDRQLP